MAVRLSRASIFSVADKFTVVVAMIDAGTVVTDRCCSLAKAWTAKEFYISHPEFIHVYFRLR